MADRTSIEWTDATWNPVTGCTEVSPGCDHCYARTFAERWRGVPGHPYTHGFDVQLRPERLTMPLRWRRPRRIFVTSMSDLFHDDVPDVFILRVFAVMAATPQHTFQVLTKRHARMRSLLTDRCRCRGFCRHTPGTHFRVGMSYQAQQLDLDHRAVYNAAWPLPNVWLGVSVEDQKTADRRIPALLDTPAAVRFLSCEPLLGPINLARWLPCQRADLCGPLLRGGWCECPSAHHDNRAPDWVIVGGESGPAARPMDPAWPRSLRDQCQAAEVPFLFKQWGQWAPAGLGIGLFRPPERLIGPPLDELGHRQIVRRVGKHAAGRELDGRTWDEFPGGAG